MVGESARARPVVVLVAQRFVKRPEQVEAVQFLGTESSIRQLEGFLGCDREGRLGVDGDGMATFLVDTWHGRFPVTAPGWVVRDAAGQVHIYPNDQFQADYAPEIESRP